MGGNRPKRLSVAVVASVVALIATAGGCTDDHSADADEVRAADAFTAIVDWQAGEQAPVTNARGELQLPVIFVVADDDQTIAVGVQAAVAASTVDVATVRFADDVTDTFDPKLEGEPVREQGVLLVIGEMPAPAPSITVGVTRYQNVDDGESFRVTIAAGGPGTSETKDAPRAWVTSATPT